ncbi:gamma-glutamylcyclotransferase [Metabacillus sp. FJAT-53654]|uniref:Gamma-glutamylcyclotransferase family protein n=1 Tax=Metabacillus rhizosphaerae TaxID=3117747 RepID=A0ABZ2MMP7_9BACI
MHRKILVFVYGTLRQYEQNEHLLRGAKCLARHCWTSGILYDTGKGYPAMCCDPLQRVYGELYEISYEQLQTLDVLEGYRGENKSNLYDRIIQSVFTDLIRYDNVFVYIYKNTQEKMTHIPYGDWKCHRYLNNDNLLYFAYGSCMDDERFRKSKVDHLFKLVKGCGKAHGFSLAYTRKSSDGGRADIIEAKNTVEGKVYKITKECLSYLYRREGVQAKIYRPAFIDIEMNGKTYTNVLTFLVIDKNEETAPPEHYAREILRGAKGFVSDQYFEKLKDELYKKFNMIVSI